MTGKKILTLLLAGAVALGSFTAVTRVEAKSRSLTLAFGNTGEKEQAALAEIFKEYETLTGTSIETVMEEEQPDVCVGDFSEIAETYKKGELYNLYSYTEKESPYSDAKTWGDALPKEIRDRLSVYKREIPGYPAGRTVVRLFCNEDLFEKAGLEIPETWSEWIKVCEAFQKQEIIPCVYPDRGASEQTWQWLMNSLLNQLDGNMADLLDETEDRYVEFAEACKAADQGNLDYTRPQIRAALECMKEFHDSCAGLGQGMGDQEALELFARGGAAMVLATNEGMESLGEDFSWRAVPFPTVTKETSEYASGRSVAPGGEATRFYGISAACGKDKEQLSVAVDFLQYVTSESVQERMAEETGLLPSAKEAELPENMKDFAFTEDPLMMPYFSGLDMENREEIRECIGGYMSGNINTATLAEQLNTSCQKAAKRICEEKGWTLVNNYGMPTAGDCNRCAP